MKGAITFALIIVAALALAPAAFADVVVGSGGWQSWGIGDLYSGSGLNSAAGVTSPFWNNGSSDSPGYGLNIGHCLTTGAVGDNCSITDAPGAIQYYGLGSGAANFTMQSTGSS